MSVALPKYCLPAATARVLRPSAARGLGQLAPCILKQYDGPYSIGDAVAPKAASRRAIIAVGNMMQIGFRRAQDSTTDINRRSQALYTKVLPIYEWPAHACDLQILPCHVRQTGSEIVTSGRQPGSSIGNFTFSLVQTTISQNALAVNLGKIGIAGGRNYSLNKVHAIYWRQAIFRP